MTAADHSLLQIPGDKAARDAADILNHTDRDKLTGPAAAAAHALGRSLHRRYYIDGHQVGTFLADLRHAGYRIVKVDDQPTAPATPAAAAATPAPRRADRRPGRTAANATAG